jgi:hypothetical protein
MPGPRPASRVVRVLVALGARETPVENPVDNAPGLHPQRAVAEVIQAVATDERVDLLMQFRVRRGRDLLPQPRADQRLGRVDRVPRMVQRDAGVRAARAGRKESYIWWLGPATKRGYAKMKIRVGIN